MKKVVYQASIKFKWDGDKVTPWMYCESANTFYHTLEECRRSVEREIKRRKNTDQPIVKYSIEMITKECVEEVEVN